MSCLDYKEGFDTKTLFVKDKLINGVISVMNLKDAPAGHPLCCIVKAKVGIEAYIGGRPD